jgi:4-amino-4-deoxy-L-arabinose transferase-like glycosyltransferase
MARETVTDAGEREAMPGTWRARRKVLLVLATFVPMVLMVYSVNASVMAPPGHGMLLAVTSLLVTGVGGYVIWDSLTALARAQATARARRAPSRPAHRTS